MTSAPHRHIYEWKADKLSFLTMYGSMGCRAHLGPTIGRSSTAITTEVLAFLLQDPTYNPAHMYWDSVQYVLYVDVDYIMSV